jgi:hypothetical protein
MRRGRRKDGPSNGKHCQMAGQLLDRVPRGDGTPPGTRCARGATGAPRVRAVPASGVVKRFSKLGYGQSIAPPEAEAAADDCCLGQSMAGCPEAATALRARTERTATDAVRNRLNMSAPFGKLQVSGGSRDPARRSET